MAGGPENLPIGATPRIVTPTPEEFDQALAILHPADHASLLALGEKPDLPFLLVRPFIDPPQEVLEPLHDDIARILQVHGAEHTWTSAGVKKPAYMGATHFDGELAAIGKEDLYQRISGLALAVKMCAALPQTATQPQTATSEKASSSSPNKTRVLTWLGLACEAGVIEYNIVDGLANQLLYPKVQASAVRSRAYLSYIYDQKFGENRSSFVPDKTIHWRAEHVVPRRSAVTLDRVRLFVQPEGTSTYERAK